MRQVTWGFVMRLMFVPLSVLPLPAAAQDPSAAASPPESAPWYVYMRAGSASAEYAFAAYSFGRPAFMAGIVADAENGYDELLAGAGVNAYSAAGNGAAFYVMASKASDSWYGVVYALPGATLGRLNVTAFAGGYLPLEPQGVRQVFVDPVTVLWRASPRVAVGTSYAFTAIERMAPKAGIGPSLQLTVPRGSLTLDAMQPIANTRAELRATLQLAF